MRHTRSSRGLRHSRSWLAAAAGVALATQPAVGEDDAVAEQLLRMNDRITLLETQLRATDDELEAARARVDSQQELIERAGLSEAGPELSGLARFLEQTEVEGWVAASWWWNFANPENASGAGANRGNPLLGSAADGLAYPVHPDHNSFQVDEVWFRLKNAATPESRGGFGVDIVYGKTADFLNGALPASTDPPTARLPNGNVPALYQAYAEYLAPVGPGVLFTMGRFESHVGPESAGTARNYNVTWGLLKTQLQPINLDGVKARVAFGPVHLMVGGSNDANASYNIDLDDDKALLWSVGVDVSDTIRFDVNGVWGGAGLLPGASVRSLSSPARLGMVEALFRWDPSDILSAWLDLQYNWTSGWEASPIGGGPPEDVPSHPRAFAVSAASRYGFAERSGFGFRAEAIWGRDNFLDPRVLLGEGDLTLWSITGTLDHSFTDQLVVRLEGRYDSGERDGADSVFYRARNPGEFRQDQFVAGIQAIYEF